MKSAILAFCLATGLAGAATAQDAPAWSFAIHGGAGVIERDSLTPEQDAAYRAALHRALQAGSAVEWTFSGTRLSTGNIITPMANDQTAWAATRIGTITP
mgnify:CR=1 FL=1